ncbi:MAG TPA: redoxin domain-containing protein, partial [Thermodesulfobacteriota bacterium]|nr:redoxin domain-containing protein [Thermodesulfobacteriota bacterium]
MNIKRIFLLSGLALFIPFLLSHISRAEIKIGETAPSFETTDEENKAVDLKGLRGKWVVLYFYPKDDTAGCTIEAKEFTELYEEFLRNNAQVYGISTDTKESHCDFRDKYELKVPLISDEERQIMSLYNVEVSDGYASRDTVVISPQGMVIKVYRKVKPAGHAKEVLDFIKS